MSGGSGGGRRLSIPLADREHALHDKDIDDTLHDTSLLRTQMKLVEKKDFTNEARFPQLGRKSQFKTIFFPPRFGGLATSTSFWRRARFSST